MFNFASRRPGDYFIVAIDLDGSLPLDELETFERLAKVAERITLLENDQRTIDLRLTKIQ